MHCQTQSAVKLSDAGTIESDVTRGNIEFTVDVQSGAFRLKNAPEAMQWSVIQMGDAQNDTILVGQTANAAGMLNATLRIRDWSSQPTITFMRILGTAISSGVCKPL